MTTPSGTCTSCGEATAYGGVPNGLGDMCDYCYRDEHRVHSDAVSDTIRHHHLGKAAPTPHELFNTVIAEARMTGRAGTLHLPRTTAGADSSYRVELWVASWQYNEGFEYLEDPLCWAWVATRAEADDVTSWVDATYSSTRARGSRRTDDVMETKVHEAHPGHPVRSVTDTKLLFDHLATNWRGI